jgi:peptidoglycan/xylan/chitin deacetylase (PgdA/CDA1 family)
MTRPERHHSGLCVLTFHRVVTRPERDHDLRSTSFLTLLDELRGGGCRFTVDLSGEELATGAVVLTFDDGTEDHRSVAEELAIRTIPAVFFVSAANTAAAGHLGADELRELRSLGHVIGSHAVDHVPLDTMSRAEVVRQIRESKRWLEETVGSEVRYFAPPGGIAPSFLKDELAPAGYSACRSMQWGIYRSPRQRWAIPCLPVTELTVARRWISSAARRRKMPASMRIAAYGRRVIPRNLRARVRSLVHSALTPPRP